MILKQNLSHNPSSRALLPWLLGGFLGDPRALPSVFFRFSGHIAAFGRPQVFWRERKRCPRGRGSSNGFRDFGFGTLVRGPLGARGRGTFASPRTCPTSWPATRSGLMTASVVGNTSAGHFWWFQTFWVEFEGFLANYVGICSRALWTGDFLHSHFFGCSYPGDNWKFWWLQEIKNRDINQTSDLTSKSTDWLNARFQTDWN